MLAALTRVRGSHLLDNELWHELGIGPEGLSEALATGVDRLRVVS